jgi:hypothetical protein
MRDAVEVSFLEKKGARPAGDQAIDKTRNLIVAFLPRPVQGGMIEPAIFALEDPKKLGTPS